MKPLIFTTIAILLATAVVSSAQAPPTNVPASFSANDKAKAKAFDEEQAKDCQGQSDPKDCRQRRAELLLFAQVDLADWGYGVRFTGKADTETTAALRRYQRRSGLPETGRVDGLTSVQMEKDEEAVKMYPFTLPPFEFPVQWSTSFFVAMGVFRDTAAAPGEASGPIQIECDRDRGVCLEEESTHLTANVETMTIKEWTGEHILAEDRAVCYTNQLRIERASQAVVHTRVRTSNDEHCQSLPRVFEVPVPLKDVYTEQLVDGVNVQVELNRARSEAVRRVKLIPDWMMK